MKKIKNPRPQSPDLLKELGKHGFHLRKGWEKRPTGKALLKLLKKRVLLEGKLRSINYSTYAAEVVRSVAPKVAIHTRIRERSRANAGSRVY